MKEDKKCVGVWSLYLTQFLLAKDRHSGVGLPFIPFLFSLFLILDQEACDLTSSIAVRPVPDQPHLSFIHVNMVQVFGRTRRDWKDGKQKTLRFCQRSIHPLTIVTKEDDSQYVWFLSNKWFEKGSLWKTLAEKLHFCGNLKILLPSNVY